MLICNRTCNPIISLIHSFVICSLMNIAKNSFALFIVFFLLFFLSAAVVYNYMWQCFLRQYYRCFLFSYVMFLPPKIPFSEAIVFLPRQFLSVINASSVWTCVVFTDKYLHSSVCLITPPSSNTSFCCWIFIDIYNTFWTFNFQPPFLYSSKSFLVM